MTTDPAVPSRGPVTVEHRGSDGAVLWVRIDHPPVNALAGPVRAGLIRAAKAAHDERVRVAVLIGGDRCFSAGGDIDELASLANDEDARRVHSEYLDLYRSWLTVPVPTIAAIRGYALGGGLELILNCDLRYATDDAFFAASGVRMGLVESAHSLPRVLPDTVAAEMLFTARRVSAGQAAASGLVTGVVADLEAEVSEVATSIARHPAAAVRATKDVLRIARSAGSAEASEAATAHWRMLQRADAHRDAAATFLARRTR
ncbi:MAG TPA: enoyl-CoA hydratase/isomerase family protein [Mycobacteriales bacterium]